MKDEYVKFIRREQMRREKEFKVRCRGEDIIYNKVKSNYKKEEMSFAAEDAK
jgi:hypothetical protein